MRLYALKVKTLPKECRLCYYYKNTILIKKVE